MISGNQQGFSSCQGLTAPHMSWTPWPSVHGPILWAHFSAYVLRAPWPSVHGPMFWAHSSAYVLPLPPALCAWSYVMRSLLCTCAAVLPLLPLAVCTWSYVLSSPFKISRNYEAISVLKTFPTWEAFSPLSHSRGHDLTLYSYLFYLLLDRYCNTNRNLFGRVSWRVGFSLPLADEHFILMFIWCHGNQRELRFTFWTQKWWQKFNYLRSTHKVWKEKRWMRKPLSWGQESQRRAVNGELASFSWNSQTANIVNVVGLVVA